MHLNGIRRHFRDVWEYQNLKYSPATLKMFFKFIRAQSCYGMSIFPLPVTPKLDYLVLYSDHLGKLIKISIFDRISINIRQKSLQST